MGNTMNTQNLRKFLFLLLLVFSPVYSQSLDKQLFKAIENRDVKAVDNLLKKGANPNATTKKKGNSGKSYFTTALNTAIDLENNYNMVKLLIDKGANVNEPVGDETCEYDSPPLILASQYGDLEVVKLLLNKGADIAKVDDCLQTTALFVAADNENLEVAKYLIQKGADVIYPLAVYEAENGEDKAIDLLIKAGANINTKDENGYTPLMATIGWNGVEKIKLLLAKGANINAKNNEGKTVLDIAIELTPYNTESINFLKSKGAKRGKEL